MCKCVCVCVFGLVYLCVDGLYVGLLILYVDVPVFCVYGSMNVGLVVFCTLLGYTNTRIVIWWDEEIIQFF